MQLLYGIIFAMLVLCVGLVFKILPTSPFLAYLGVSEFSEYLPYMTYFVPIDAFIVISEGWLIAVTAWIILKFARKAVTTVTEITPLM